MADSYTDGPWQIACPPEKFEAWRDSEEFHALLALARIVNGIRFTHYALLDSRSQDTPAAMRQRLNSFMYTGALLFEGFGLSQKLSKYYRHLPAFQEGFMALHRDREVETLVSSTLRPLRHQVVFHSDISAVATNLRQLSESEYVFVRSEGRGSGYTYFDLADATALRVVFGSHSDPDYETRARALIQAVTQLATRFLRAFDQLVVAALASSDWALHVPPMTWRARLRAGRRKVRRWVSYVLPVLRQRM